MGAERAGSERLGEGGLLPGLNAFSLHARTCEESLEGRWNLPASPPRGRTFSALWAPYLDGCLLEPYLDGCLLDGNFPSDTFSDLCLCFKYRPCRTNTLRAKNLKVMGKKINIPYLDAHPIEMERESDEFESFPPS